MRKIFAGVDVGGGTTKACVVAGSASVASTVFATTLGTPSDLGDLAIAAVSAAVEKAGCRISDLTAIGVGVPGQVASGQVRNAANLGIDEEGYDLEGHVTAATEIPTSVENDMTVAAFGAFSRLSVDERTCH